MKLYHYDESTKMFLGTTIAREDPAELDLAIAKAIEAAPDAKAVQVTIDKWIIPKYCTTLAPSRDGLMFDVNSGSWCPPPPPPQPTKTELEQAAIAEVSLKARQALAATNERVMYLFEHNEKPPADLVEYRDKLRAIIAKPTKDTQLPAKPEGLI